MLAYMAVMAQRANIVCIKAECFGFGNGQRGLYGAHMVQFGSWNIESIRLAVGTERMV